MWLLNFVLLLLVVAAVPFLIYQMGKANFIFTIVKEGSAKIILHNGAFHRVIMQFKGFKLDGEWNVVPDNSYIPRPWGGLRWVGIPPFYSVYEYHFRWTTVRPQTGEVLRRDVKIDYILVKDDVYAIEMKEVEAKGIVPVDIELLLTMRSVNPYKSLMKVQDWAEMTFNRSESTYREYVSYLTLDDLNQQRQKTGGELYTRLSDQGLLKQFEEMYGIQIPAIEMKRIDPSNPKVKESAAKQWEAEMEARRIDTITGAENRRLDTINKTLQKYGDQALLNKFIEAIEKAKDGAGNWIIPVGGMENILSGLLGRSTDTLGRFLAEHGITQNDLIKLVESRRKSS